MDSLPWHTFATNESMLLVLVELRHIDQRAGDAVGVADEWAFGERIPATT